MRMNQNKKNQYEKILIFNGLAITKETNKELQNELRNAMIDIFRGVRKIVSVKYNSKSLELYLRKNGKKQYLKMYDNGDYIYLTDTFYY